MKRNTKEYYDEFAAWYEKERHHGYHAMLDALELDVLRPYVGGRDVLEVGAGTGLIMNGLLGTANKVVGVDISQGMLGKAADRGLEVVQGSATDLPFKDQQFDLVYSFKVLAHVPAIQQALAEMTRVLRPGGVLVAEFYNRWSVRKVAKVIGGPGKISEGGRENEVFTRWDSQTSILGYLPDELVFSEWRGIRVVTPAALAFRLPGAERVLPFLEKMTMKGPLARFGGFLIAVCHKRA